MNKTLECFQNHVPEAIKKKILCLITQKTSEKMVLDLLQLYFDYTRCEVTIEYYVEDDNFPTTKINFGDFIKLCKKCSHKE